MESFVVAVAASLRNHGIGEKEAEKTAKRISLWVSPIMTQHEIAAVVTEALNPGSRRSGTTLGPGRVLDIARDVKEALRRPGLGRRSVMWHFHYWRSGYGSPLASRLALAVFLGGFALGALGGRIESNWIGVVGGLLVVVGGISEWRILLKRDPRDLSLIFNPLAWLRDWRQAAASQIFSLWQAFLPIRPWQPWEWLMATIHAAVVAANLVLWTQLASTT